MAHPSSSPYVPIPFLLPSPFFPPFLPPPLSLSTRDPLLISIRLSLTLSLSLSLAYHISAGKDLRPPLPDAGHVDTDKRYQRRVYRKGGSEKKTILSITIHWQMRRESDR